MTFKTSTPCGDWHRGWGYSGNNKVGKLYANDDGTYTWKGHCQGRHYQRLSSSYWITFRIEGDEIIRIEASENARSLPNIQDIRSAMIHIVSPSLREQYKSAIAPRKRAPKATRPDQPNSQLSLF